MDFRPIDIARAADCSTHLVREVERELRLNPTRIGTGSQRRYSEEQARKLVSAIRQRKDPAQSLRAEAVA